MKTELLSLFMAFLGYSLHNIAQASQKIGLSISKKNRTQGLSIWISATIFTSVSIFIILYAVYLGNVSIVGAMAGSGLASLTIYTRFVMKEKVTKHGLIGVLIIMCATGLIGAATKKVKPTYISPLILIELLAGITGVFAVLWILLRRKKNKLGVFIGIFAGILGGFIPLFQKISTSQIGKAHSLARQFIHYTSLTSSVDRVILKILIKALEILANPYALTWILLSIISMIMLQFAYTQDKAIRIIPAFSAITVILPVLGGVFCFHESLPVLQWIGIVLILTGVLLITVSRTLKTEHGHKIVDNLIMKK